MPRVSPRSNFTTISLSGVWASLFVCECVYVRVHLYIFIRDNNSQSPLRTADLSVPPYNNLPFLPCLLPHKFHQITKSNSGYFQAGIYVNSFTIIIHSGTSIKHHIRLETMNILISCIFNSQFQFTSYSSISEFRFVFKLPAELSTYITQTSGFSIICLLLARTLTNA